MRLARKTLINCRIESESKRDKQINIQHDILIQQGKMALADALRLKINREQQRKCWKILRNIIHGDKTTGGISHVLIPSPTNQMPNKPPSRIQGKNDLDPTLLHRNIDHFSQAHGTPFTISPLLDMIGEDGCTQAALDILNGNIPSQIEKYSNIIL
jgi:hypothetical protein